MMPAAEAAILAAPDAVLRATLLQLAADAPGPVLAALARYAGHAAAHPELSGRDTGAGRETWALICAGVADRAAAALAGYPALPSPHPTG